jgi:putative ABC transport system substrate-binding protein
MKKILLILGITAAVFNLSGASATAAEKRFRIGLLQPVDQRSFNTIRENFIQRLAELGYNDDKVEIDYQNALGQGAKVDAICRKFVDDKVDLIAAIGSLGAQRAAAIAGDIPVVFLAVSSDPVKTGLVKNLNAPEGNVTGTTYIAPIDQIFELAGEITPSAKKFGFIYNPKEANSLLSVEKAKAYCDSHGLAYLEATVKEASEVPQAANSLLGQVDALFCPNDNTVASVMPIVSKAAIDAKTPAYVGGVTMVIDGGLATVGVDSGEMGILSANMVAELLSGKKISELPVVVVQKYSLRVNKKTAAAIGVDVSAYTSVD